MVTTTWVMLTRRKSIPKPENRRIADMSVVARDSSCPDCQRLWKLIGSSCSRW